jgi:alkylation response protein AidB-like acyl-CoA dehydrogenase
MAPTWTPDVIRGQAVVRPSEVGQGRSSWSTPAVRAKVAISTRKITQIYEGTNQVQRLVMARSLLR